MRPLLRFLHYPYLLWGHCGRGYYLAGRKIYHLLWPHHDPDRDRGAAGGIVMLLHSLTTSKAVIKP